MPRTSGPGLHFGIQPACFLVTASSFGKAPTIQSDLKTRFFAAAFTAVITLGMAGTGMGSTIWFENVDIAVPSTPAGVYVDLTTSTTGVEPFDGGDANLWFGGYLVGNEGDLPTVPSPSWQPVRLTNDNLATVANLPLGTTVGASSDYGNSFGGSFDHVSSGEFIDGVPGYLGFSLDNGSGPVYGWMHLTIHFDPAGVGGGVIHSWAYDDSGNSIPVGVPEPGTWMLALLGLGTIIARRKR